MKILAICILIVSVSLVGACTNSKKADADAVIGKIEAFQRENSRLPESLSEVGVSEKEEGPVYYQKKNSSSYEVWYGTSLGESEVYDSIKGSWN